jgi:hypothetical protein
MSDWRQVDVPDPIGILIRGPRRHLDAETDLAGTACTRQGDQPAVSKDTRQLIELDATADKAGQLSWKTLGCNRFRLP